MMTEMTNVLDINIPREKWLFMMPEEKKQFIDKVINAMTLEQIRQMARIGERVIKDDIFQRADDRSRTALRTMARAVHVTVNEVK